MNYIYSTICLLIMVLSGYGQEQFKHEQNLKDLNFLLGTWQVEVNARLSLQGPWEKSNAKSKISKALESSMIEEEFTGRRMGKAFLSKTFFAINNGSNKFQRIFIDAPHGMFIDFEGIKSNDSIIFDKTLKNASNSIVKLRVVYKLLSKDSFSVVTMRMPPDSNKWDVNGRMRYERH